MKQSIYEQSATPKYPVGKRIYQGDRVFRYCYALTGIALKKPGCINADFVEGNTAVIAAAGDLDITIVGDLAADYLAGGYITVWTTIMQMLLAVKGNDVGDGVNTVVHLAHPLLRDVPLATYTVSRVALYNRLGEKSVHAAYESCICIPLLSITAGYYFWGQTWGPVLGKAAAGSGIGENIDERDVYFTQDGAIDIQAAVGTWQRAGFMLSRTQLGDDIFFMLQLAP